jgi:hypothetical protein
MKPVAQNYVFPALLIIFGLNKLMLLILTQVGPNYENVLLILFSFLQVTVATGLTALFFVNSNEYDRKNRSQNSK